MELKKPFQEPVKRLAKPGEDWSAISKTSDSLSNNPTSGLK